MDARAIIWTSLATMLVLAPPTAADQGQASQSYGIVSGPMGTPPYVIGVSLESLVNLKLRPEFQFGLSSLVSQGHADSLRAMRAGDGQFAIADSVTAEAAALGTGRFEATGPADDLRAVAVLWQEVDHFLVTPDRAPSGTIADLLTLDAAAIATEAANQEATKALLLRLGLAGAEAAPLPVLDRAEGLAALNGGTVAALVWTRPHAAPEVGSLVGMLGERAQMLEFTGRQLAQLGQGWLAYPIDAGAAPGLTHAFNTAARSVMLLTSASMADDVVYHVTRVMYENLVMLAAMDEAGKLITLEGALNGMTVPLHPGAARYYQEAGLLPAGSNDPVAALPLQSAAPDQAAGRALPGEVAQPARAPLSKPAPAAGSLPSLVLDEAMLARSRAEIHDGAEVLKIDRPEQLDRSGTEITSVYFGLGSTQLDAQGAADMAALGQRILAQYRASQNAPEIYVEGHADRSGDWKINYEIAHRRAQAAKAGLVAAGVPEDWVLISDHSEAKPAVATADGVGDGRNRRVEVTVVPRAQPGARTTARAQ